MAGLALAARWRKYLTWTDEMLSGKMISLQSWRRANGAIICATVLSVASPASAMDGGNAELIELIGNCARIAEPAGRLDCYDSLNESLRPDLPAEASAMTDAAAGAAGQAADDAIDISVDRSPAQAAAAAGPIESSMPATREPGKRPLFSKKSDRPPPVELTLIDSKKDSYGRWLFYFDNGEVWRQNEKGHITIPEGDAVPATLSTAIFGSFDLRLGDNRRKIKVKRVK